jgi:hypothetical protein
MSDLLDLAIDAHGGLDRWQKLSKVSARASIGGATWRLKRQPDAPDVRIKATLHEQHVEFWPYKAPGTHSIYEPDRVTVKADDGPVLDSRTNPRGSFAGHTLTTPWDELHVVYFRGYAIWTYLTAPFSLREPGFKSQEIEPWSENGQAWRRLQVTFPKNVHSHSTEQVFYFDAKGLLRRHDYSVDIIGGSHSAHYATEHKTLGGIVFPTKRRVYAYGLDNKPILDSVAAVSIDFHEIAVE